MPAALASAGCVTVEPGGGTALPGTGTPFDRGGTRACGGNGGPFARCAGRPRRVVDARARRTEIDRTGPAAAVAAARGRTPPRTRPSRSRRTSAFREQHRSFTSRHRPPRRRNPDRPAGCSARRTPVARHRAGSAAAYVRDRTNKGKRPPDDVAAPRGTGRGMAWHGMAWYGTGIPKRGARHKLAFCRHTVLVRTATGRRRRMDLDASGGPDGPERRERPIVSEEPTASAYRAGGPKVSPAAVVRRSAKRRTGSGSDRRAPPLPPAPSTGPEMARDVVRPAAAWQIGGQRTYQRT